MKNITILAVLGMITFTDAMRITQAQTENQTTPVELPFITQKTKYKGCDGPFRRHQEEGFGQIAVPEGQIFSDKSFRYKTAKRPHEFEEEGVQPSLWGSKGIIPDAIDQGMLGDCWFLSAVSSMAEWPERVKAMFNGIESYPENGQFVLNFWNFGKKVRVTIDDKIPFYKNREGEEKIRYSHQSKNGAWWGPILEKAGAKFYGAYGALSGGWMNEAFYLLTGMPTKHLSHKNWSIDEMWNKLQEYDQAHYLINAATSRKKYGLVGRHAYTTIGVKEYNGEKLVHIRNPWASERYKGPWSDRDTAKWTDEAKAFLNHENDNDGTFWMPVSAYKEAFSSTNVAFYDEDWKRQVKQDTWNRDTFKKDDETTYPRWTISNPSKQKVIVGIQGAQLRQFRNRDCKDSKKWENIQVYVTPKGKAFKDRMTDSYNHNYDFSHRFDGQGWFVFDNLPEGEYDIQLRVVGLIYNEGEMPLSVQTFAKTEDVPITRSGLQELTE